MPPTEPASPLALRPRTLVMIAAGGLVGGALIVVGAILPAEYNVDPLGVGRLTGLSRLWAPDEKAWKPGAEQTVAFSSATPILRHAVEINLGAEGWDEAALEYKVAMVPGQAFLYRWEVLPQAGGAVAPIEFELHGHTLEDEKAMTVADYHKGRALADNGALSAPFAGIHGWYFRNHAPDPVVVRLEIEGFYELIPPGKPGNEFRIRPLEPGSKPQPAYETTP